MNYSRDHSVSRVSLQNQVACSFVVHEAYQVFGLQGLFPKVKASEDSKGLEFSNCLFLILSHEWLAEGSWDPLAKPWDDGAVLVNQDAANASLFGFTVKTSIGEHQVSVLSVAVHQPWVRLLYPLSNITQGLQRALLEDIPSGGMQGVLTQLVDQPLHSSAK